MPSPGPANRLRDHAVAAAWGAAEATFLPVVPDVWISKVALRDPRRALATTVTATAGAVAGGLLTRAWAARRPRGRSEDALVRLPSIDRAMTRGVLDAVRAKGPGVMLLGPATGRPYKLYARAAGVLGMSAGTFAAWSVPARLPRFLVLAAVPGALARGATRRGMRPGTVGACHAVAWALFFAGYLSTVGRGD